MFSVQFKRKCYLKNCHKCASERTITLMSHSLKWVNKSNSLIIALLLQRQKKVGAFPGIIRQLLGHAQGRVLSQNSKRINSLLFHSIK